VKAKVINRLSNIVELLKRSEDIAKTLPYWYNRLCKIKILDFDFE
jgi:hypothetical protein